MKNKHLFLLISLFISINALAQNTKHQLSSGKVVFDITYPDSQMDEQTMANMPTESIMKFKDDKVKVEVSMPMGKTTVISDNKSSKGVMLMDMMGNKMAIEMDKDELTKGKDNSKPKIEMTRESKKIAGYDCNKAVVTVKTDNGEKSFDAWFTNQIKLKNSFATSIDGIDGFLMEFYTMENGTGMKMAARTVEPMDIDDSEFNVPDGYKKMTMDDLKNMGGK